VRPRHPIALAATLAVAAAASAGLAGTSLTALLGDPSPSDDHPAAASSVVTARVTDVVDGDTVRVQTRDGRDLGRVRLLGIVH